MWKSAGRKSKLQARVLRCIRATPRGSKTTQEQKHMFSSNNKNKQGISQRRGEGVSYSGAEWVGKKSKFYAALATANICRRPLPSRQSSMPGGVVCTQVRKGRGGTKSTVRGWGPQAAKYEICVAVCLTRYLFLFAISLCTCNIAHICLTACSSTRIYTQYIHVY